MIKTWQIGNIEIQNQLVLAPMAGYTDSPFRYLCKKNGAGLVYTEMISSLGLCFENTKTNHLLKYKQEEHPIIVQLFGSNPEKLAQAAQITENLGFDAVDINMGCPAPKIVKGGGGGVLLTDFDLIERLLNTVVKAVKIPVTVKIRYAYLPDVYIAEDVAKIAENCGVKCIAIHASSVKQKSEGSRDWNIIKKVKEKSKIPVIANGGIKSVEDINKILDNTGVDAVMIGRAALGKPWFFKDALIYLKDGNIVNSKKNIELIFDNLFEHIKLEREIRDDITTIKELRKQIPFYLKGLPESGKIKDEINKISNMNNLLNILRNYKNSFF